MDALINQKTKEPCIEIISDLNASDKKIQLTIRDNGPGIPNEILKTVFEPFVTRKKTTELVLGLLL